MIKLKLNKDGKFECDRISGSKEDVEGLGFKICGEESDDSYMWDYENIDIIPEDPEKEYAVGLNFDEDGDWEYGDFVFETFAVGYASVDDFTILSGHDPFPKVGK